MQHAKLGYLPTLISLIFSTHLYAENTASTEQDVSTQLEAITVIGKQDSYFESENKTALKMAADNMSTPFTVTSINSTMIEDLKANRLDDVYGYLTGFSRSGVTANSFTIRGMSADLQNIQVDGLPGLVSRFGSPVTANIDHIEVLKGPSSVLYGWMDPGGLLNIITKKPEEDSFQSLDVSYKYYPEQSEGGFETSLDVNGSLNEDGTVLYRLIAGGENQDSFRDYVDSKSVYFFPSIAFVGDKTRLDAQFEYTKDDRKADNGLFVLDQDISTLADIETYYQEPGDTDNDLGRALSLELNHQFNQQLSSTVKWRSVWHEDERDLYESNAVSNDDTLRRRNRHQYNEREYHFLDANLNAKLGDTIQHDVLVGINSGYEYRQYDRLAFDTRGANVAIYDPVYTGDILEDDPGNFRQWDLYNYGAYLFDRVTLTEKLTAVAGVRYDYQSGEYELRYLDKETTQYEQTHTSSSNFSGGLVYQVTKPVSVYVSYAESFNPQTVATFDENGNQLDPEQGEQYELGFKVSALDERINFSTAYFDIKKDNVSETDSNTGFPDLVGQVVSKGIESNLQYLITDNMQVQLGYTYVDAEVRKTFNDDALGNVPGFSPKHNAFAWMRYNYPQKVLGGLVGASLGVKFESKRYTDEETSKRVLLPSYTVVDAAVYYEREQMKYALNVGNITNREYYVGGTNDTRIYVGDPLNITLSATFDFY